MLKVTKVQLPESLIHVVRIIFNLCRHVRSGRHFQRCVVSFKKIFFYCDFMLAGILSKGALLQKQIVTQEKPLIQYWTQPGHPNTLIDLSLSPSLCFLTLFSYP